MKRIEIIEEIQGATPNDKIKSLSLLNYETLPVTDDLIDNDIPSWGNVLEIVGDISTNTFIYHLPAGSATPVIINFIFNTIKLGGASAVAIGSDLEKYQSNPTIRFNVIIDTTNTKPIGNDGWITNEEWADNTYTSLVALTLQPDTDTGMSGGLTLDNINIIIKP